MHELHQNNGRWDVLVLTQILGVTTLNLSLLACLWIVIIFARRLAVPFVIVVSLGVLFLTSALVFHNPASDWYIPNDGDFYWDWAVAMSRGEDKYPDYPVWPGKGVWPYLVSHMIALGGPSIYFPLILNVCLTLLAVLVSLKSASLLSNSFNKWGLLALFGSWFPFWLFGPSMLREAIFWLGISLGTLSLLHLRRAENVKGILVMLSSILLLLAIRPDAGLILAYAFLAAGMVAYLSILPNGLKPKLALAGLAAALIWLFPTALDAVRPGVAEDPSIVGRIAVDGAREIRTSAFQPLPIGPADEPAGEYEPIFWEADFCLDNLYVATICNGIVNLPYALAGPFPWEFRWDPAILVAVGSTLHFLVVVGLAISFFVRSEKDRIGVLLLSGVASVALLLFSSILTNYGTLMRFRVVVELILLPFAIAAMQSLCRATQSRRHVI